LIAIGKVLKSLWNSHKVGLDCASAEGILHRAISDIKIVERCLLLLNDGVVILA
jgi:hypothetical protein